MIGPFSLFFSFLKKIICSLEIIDYFIFSAKTDPKFAGMDLDLELKRHYTLDPAPMFEGISNEDRRLLNQDMVSRSLLFFIAPHT